MVTHTKYTIVSFNICDMLMDIFIELKHIGKKRIAPCSLLHFAFSRPPWLGVSPPVLYRTKEHKPLKIQYTMYQKLLKSGKGRQVTD